MKIDRQRVVARFKQLALARGRDTAGRRVPDSKNRIPRVQSERPPKVPPERVSVAALGLLLACSLATAGRKQRTRRGSPCPLPPIPDDRPKQLGDFQQLRRRCLLPGRPTETELPLRRIQIFP